MRQLVAENLILSVLGGIGAMIFALATARILERLPFLPVPDAFSVVLDWKVILFATVVSFATTFLFGIRPASQAIGKDVVISLNPGATGETHARIRSTLIVTQVTICTAMLITAAVLVRSQDIVRTNDRGFESDHVLLASVNFVGTKYSPEQVRDFYDKAVERLNGTPGIASASIVDSLPVVSSWAGVFQFGGTARTLHLRSDAGDRDYAAYTSIVSTRYFSALRIPLIQGRDFELQDSLAAPGVGIINETFARQAWPGESAIGRRLRLEDGSSVQVIGVVRSGKYKSADESPQLALYMPLSQDPQPQANTLVIRTGPAPLAMSSRVRSKIAEIDPNVLVYNIHTFDQRLELGLLIYRIIAYIAGIPGALAFLLGIIGTYGTMALIVAQRRREIGIRIALGAHPSQAVTLVLRQGMKWAALGLLLGIAGGLIATFWLSRYIERVTWSDPAAFAGTAALVALTAATACFIPARRASRVEPMAVLREE
jgi:predicted permease